MIRNFENDEEKAEYFFANYFYYNDPLDFEEWLNIRNRNYEPPNPEDDEPF